MGWGNVLIATDFSPRAEAALARGYELARDTGDALTVMHVRAETGLALHALSPLAAADVERALTEEAHSRVEATADQLRAVNGVSVTTVVRTGAAHHEIRAEALDRHAGIIVLGAHGGHFIADLVLGTTAEKVVRKAAVPVLVVRKPADRPYRSVVVASDFSDGAACAMGLAVQLGAEADFHLLHVHDPWYLERLRTELGVSGLDQYVAALKAELIVKLRDSAAAAGLPEVRCHYHVALGYPGTEIPRLAGVHGADLIIVGSRGQSGLSEVLLGSTGEHVLREAPCDVLVAR